MASVFLTVIISRRTTDAGAEICRRRTGKDTDAHASSVTTVAGAETCRRRTGKDTDAHASLVTRLQLRGLTGGARVLSLCAQWSGQSLRTGGKELNVANFIVASLIY